MNIMKQLGEIAYYMKLCSEGESLTADLWESLDHVSPSAPSANMFITVSCIPVPLASPPLLVSSLVTIQDAKENHHKPIQEVQNNTVCLLALKI